MCDINPDNYCQLFKIHSFNIAILKIKLNQDNDINSEINSYSDFFFKKNNFISNIIEN